jgi:hypothetical protein
VATNALTAVNAQERANTIPRLHKAKTVACGLVKWGKRVWIIVVHAVTRGWQDILFLLGRIFPPTLSKSFPATLSYS